MADGGQSRPQSPRPLDQRSGSAWALVESKTGTRISWFRFDSARASEIVVEMKEMNKFQPPMRFGRFFWRAFSLAQRSRFLAQSRRIAGSGDEIGWRMADGGWRMADDGWKNADDKMRMEKCGWKNADGKMRMEKCG